MPPPLSTPTPSPRHRKMLEGCLVLPLSVRVFILMTLTTVIKPLLPKKVIKRKVQGVPQSQTAALPRPKRKRKPTNLNKHKPNKRTKSTKISSLFPKRGNRNTKRTEKHKNKMTQKKTYNKSPRRINHKATKSKSLTPGGLLYRSF